MPELEQNQSEPKAFTVPVGISNRHIHLTKEDLEQLFGKGYELTKVKDLTQPGEYAANEKVIIVGPKGAMEGVRVLGPLRKRTQIEISLTDSYKLGVKPPVRDSGDLEGSPGITIVGPKGSVILQEGVIVAARHIHLHTSEAEELGVENGQRVRVEVEGDRSVVFNNVLLRVSPKYAKEIHFDTDEANGAMLKNGDLVKVLL
ncbi:MAG TPA: phosphate propanoyltransferase [Clostridia bacterium]|jgi:putative phosphotransacetylase|nr:phosphate propanoyltransferase [Clostridia bacterium]